jgi:hypothetical protein
MSSSSDGGDSSDSSDEDDSRGKNDYSSMPGYIKPPDSATQKQYHMISTNGRDGLKPYKQGGKGVMFKFLNSNTQIQIMRDGKYEHRRITDYDDLPEGNIRWMNSDSGLEGIMLITKGGKKSASSSAIIKKWKGR